MMNMYQGGIKHKLSGEEAKEGMSTMNADKRQGRKGGCEYSEPK